MGDHVSTQLRDTLLSLALALAILASCLGVSAVTTALDISPLYALVERMLRVPVRADLDAGQGKFVEQRIGDAAQAAAPTPERTLFERKTPFEEIRTPVAAIRPNEPEAAAGALRDAMESPVAPKRSLTQQELDTALGTALLPAPVIHRRAGAAAPSIPSPNLGALYQSGREGAGGAGRPGTESHAVRPDEFSPTMFSPRVEIPDGAMPEPKRNVVADALALQKATVEAPREQVYPSLDKEVTATFNVYREPNTDERYFRLEIAVRDDATIPVIPKDVLYLVDVSASIRGDELSRMRDAVLADIAQLPAADRWNCAVFSETSEFFAPTFQPATKDPAVLEKARLFLRRLENEDATNVFQITSRILESLPDNPRPVVVYLVSDGAANAGTSDIRSLVSSFQRVRRDAFSIFGFNAGPGGNTFLLELLSYRSRGFAAAEPVIDAAPGHFAAFSRQFSRPVLTAVVANYTNLEETEVYPKVLPDLYRDTPITLCGRCRKGDVVSMRVAGYGAQGPREFFFRTRIPDGDGEHPEIAALWARGKANALMAELGDNPKNEELRARIRSLAQTYGLASVPDMLKDDQGILDKLKSSVLGK